MGIPLPLAKPRTLSRSSARRRSRIAAVCAIAALCFLLAILLANFEPEILNVDYLPSRVYFYLSWSLAVVLWILMWWEYARERPNHRLIWAFLLMTGPFLGPLLFYFLVWRRRYPQLGSV